MHNVESKFRCSEHDRVFRRGIHAGASDEGVIDQRDVFFPVGRGRLKLRFLAGQGELIAHKRDNLSVARPSEYEIFVTDAPMALEKVLSRALPPGATIVKRRHLLLIDHTRIHLDDVAGLGRFVELETVVAGLNDAQAQQEHASVIAILGLGSTERVAVGYVDLLG